MGLGLAAVPCGPKSSIFVTMEMAPLALFFTGYSASLPCTRCTMWEHHGTSGHPVEFLCRVHGAGVSGHSRQGLWGMTSMDLCVCGSSGCSGGHRPGVPGLGGTVGRTPQVWSGPSAVGRVFWVQWGALLCVLQTGALGLLSVGPCCCITFGSEGVDSMPFCRAM
jgi:hypothetical protein